MCDTSTGCYSGLYTILNYSTQLNSSQREELLRIYWEEVAELENQSEIPITLLIVTILIFMSMILFGSFGSSLVIYVVLRKRSMRTRGNLFILNLAISDLTLCLITQPFNLLRLLTGNRNWILGQFMCKFSAMFQGTNIFVSTFSITAIAIDRFQCIIYPTTHRGNINTAIKVNYVTWIMAFLLASPLVYFSHITQLHHLQCTEKADNPTVQKFKVFYSLAALIIQYMTPLVIVTIVYYRICLSIRDRKLRAIQKMCLSQIVRMPIDQQTIQHDNALQINNNKLHSCIKTCINNSNESNSNMYCLSNINLHDNIHRNPLEKHNPIKSPIPSISKSSQKEAIDRRHRKAIILSTMIAIIFFLSWLPTNTMNVISDIRELIIVTSIDVAMKKLKLNEFDEYLMHNNTINVVSTVTDSIIQQTTTSLKVISKIMSIEANNIDAITVIITQALCLLLILSSACVNPILYGWLNKTFRHEFYQVLHIHSTTLQNTKSSHKNMSIDISQNKNNEVDRNYVNSKENLNQFPVIEQEETDEEYLQQQQQHHYHHYHHHHQQQQHHHHHQQQQTLSNDYINRVRFEKRSLTPTQDSCTLFSLFTSRSNELNSAQNSMNSESIIITPTKSVTNHIHYINNNNNDSNNSNNNNDLTDHKTTQLMTMNYFQLKNDELFNTFSEQNIHEHDFNQKSSQSKIQQRDDRDWTNNSNNK
ncbi:Neuropeptide Y receptor type 2 [Schistosoma japonicum]|uniref:Neuropeptide Y receptor type 2 n=1 Tax=Schistosoma japonicum TaxID=6182 RepID=A0A4Z2CZM1_SCHJA|nr:Neuropeptide Y receptor type 2 [Schistosoma japonicum]